MKYRKKWKISIFCLLFLFAKVSVQTCFCTGFLSHQGIRHSQELSCNWRALRNRYVVRQQYRFSCGIASLATILTYVYDEDVSEDILLDKINIKEPISFATLKELAELYDVVATGYRMTWEGFKNNITSPCIVAFQDSPQGHFAVCYAIDQKNKSLLLGDPSWGLRRVSFAHFLKAWCFGGQGYVLTFFPKKASLRSLADQKIVKIEKEQKQYHRHLDQNLLLSIIRTSFRP